MRREMLASSRKIKRKRMILKAVLFLIAFGMFFFVVVGFFYLPFFKIKKIEIRGNNFVGAEILIDTARSIINEKYWKIFPQDNIFIIPKEKILKELSVKFKRIKKIKIDRNFPSAISIKIEERSNAALLRERENCAFIDENGYVFERASCFSGGIFINFFDERNAVKTATTTSVRDINKILGANLLNEEEFKKIMDFAKLSAKTGDGVVRVVLKKENNYEIYTKEGWKMILNNKNNPQAAYLNLTTALESTIKEERRKLDYIDLRYGNKIYFKYK